MTFFSMRTRKKLWIYGWSAAAAVTAIVVQNTLLSQFPVKESVPVCCNLPLTLVILWGAIYGSPLPPISPDELRLSTASQIFMRQAMSGSVVGAIMGCLMAALYAPMLPIFPAYLIFAGWTAGYFCMRNTNSMLSFLCMPLVLVITLLAETTMAWQLSLVGRAGAFDNLMQIALPEAALNAILAPFIYFPLRRWYEISTAVKLVPHR